MAVSSNRSMNDDMRIGAVDGRLRFLRPNSVNAEMEETLIRAHALRGDDPPFYGFYGCFGTTYGDLEKIRGALPAAVHPLHPIRVSKHEVVDPL
jgi:hypothetical protein